MRDLGQQRSHQQGWKPASWDRTGTTRLLFRAAWLEICAVLLR